MVNLKRPRYFLMPLKRLVTLMFILVGCGPGSTKEKGLALHAPEPRETIESGALSIPVYDFDGLEPLLHLEDGDTYIVNFWATWCAPCVKELPYMEQIQSDYKDRGLQVLLVSLDMPRMWDSHLVPFVKERNLKSHVVVLDDPSQNTWIPLVDQDWSGAIPATLIYNREKRMFFEEAFSYERLNEVLSNFNL